MLTRLVAETSSCTALHLSSCKLCCRKSPNKEFIRLNLGTLVLLPFELVNLDQGNRKRKQELYVGCVQVREPACSSLSENQERRLVVTLAYCHSGTLALLDLIAYKHKTISAIYFFFFFFFFHFHTTATTPGDMRCVTLWCGRWYSDWLFPSAGVPLWLVNLAKEDLRLHFCALTSLERPPHMPTHARDLEEKKQWLRQEMCVEIPFHWYIRRFLGQSFLHHLLFIQNVKVAVFLCHD